MNDSLVVCTIGVSGDLVMITVKTPLSRMTGTAESLADAAGKLEDLVMAGLSNSSKALEAATTNQTG